MQAATSTNFAFTTSDLTIDFWVFPNENNQHYISMGDPYSDAGAFSIYSTGTSTELIFNSGAATSVTTLATTALSLNAWNHVAAIRSDNNFYLAVAGIFSSAVAITATNVGIATSFLDIGYNTLSGTSYHFGGYLDEVRITTKPLWSEDFTPEIVSSGDFNHIDFDTFLGSMIASGEDIPPFSWKDSSTTATAMTVVIGLSGAKFIKKFQNYCIMANVRVGGIRYPSRFYWSKILTIDQWSTTDWIAVSKDDGDEISGLRVLGDRLVFYKENSIYVAIFTGDVNIPFLIQKTPSAVGCVAPYSIQEAENGHIFASQDGIYFFDGWNSYKISDKISDTYDGINKEQLENAVSMYQRTKNLYSIFVASGSSLKNEFVLTWNSFLQAWSKYAGMSASAMAIFMVNGTEEQPHIADYTGYTYRGDTGIDDFPTNIQTAITANYFTNWKSYEDLCDKKGVPHAYIVHRNESSTNLTFVYAYDFYNGDQYSSSFSLFTTQTVTALTTRRDLTGRGNFVRLGWRNNTSGTSFRVDGLGTYITRESKA